MEAAIGPDENGRVKRENKEIIRRTRNEVNRIALVVGIVELVRDSLM
jgi:hypothetical protein